MREHICTQMHACNAAHTRTQSHSHTYTVTRSRTCLRIHTDTHACVHAHPHVHSRPCKCPKTSPVKRCLTLQIHCHHDALISLPGITFLFAKGTADTTLRQGSWMPRVSLKGHLAVADKWSLSDYAEGPWWVTKKTQALPGSDSYQELRATGHS